MIGGLKSVRALCGRPVEAVRWACILEATAPKAGNVFPGCDFDDLTYVDFVSAAEITAAMFEGLTESFSQVVLNASVSIAQKLGTNVNLGILLLLGPLVQADVSDGWSRRTRVDLRSQIKEVLGALDAQDSDRLYAAINAASPGGMGTSDQMDLSSPAPDDFISAMKTARSRDRIALNYGDGFSDLFDSVVPTLEDSIAMENDLLSGIARGHQRLLISEPDSLIMRKFGPEVALDVQKEADFDHDDIAKRKAFDQFLRSGTKDLEGKTSTINPGTTADLIAAALYVLLREIED